MGETETDNKPTRVWNPRVRCRQCDAVMHSRYEGEFVGCEHIFVDQTRYYARYGGNPEDMEFLDDDYCSND